MININIVKNHLFREKKMLIIVTSVRVILILQTFWAFIFENLNNLAIQVRVMVFNATFNNISVLSWRSVLLVGETGVSGENY